jgi:hypothetical protein
MTHKLGLTLVMALLLAGAGIFSSVNGSVAQTVQDRSDRDNGRQREIRRPPDIGRERRQPDIGQERRERDIGQERRERDIGQERREREIGERKLGRIREASRATIAGRDYSIWRGGHRVRYDDDWRTFAGLSALSAIMVGSAYYYPYAYIDAPAPYCEGLTEDDCQLEWKAVPTLEGPTEFVCVAYCPWQ